MKEPRKTVWFWLPRVIGIVFTLFISMFGFDVFDMGLGFPEIILALIMDMLPAILVAVMVAISWRWEWVGTVLCVGLAALYFIVMGKHMDWVTVLLIPGPLIILAGLWLAAWLQKRKYLQAQAA